MDDLIAEKAGQLSCPPSFNSLIINPSHDFVLTAFTRNHLNL